MKQVKRSGCLVGLAIIGLTSTSLPAAPLEVHLRQRVETAPGKGHYAVIQTTQQWEGRRTALVV